MANANWDAAKLNKVRADFPLLTKKVRGKNLVYLDSAATSLKPWPVIERLSQFYTYETANVHRGAHYLADQATRAFEEARESVRSFINAESAAEVIFTKGTTEGLNLLAQTWGLQNLKPGDEVLLTQMEHHANIVPWQLIQERTGLQIKVVGLTPQGELDLEDLEKKLTSKTKLLSITACSNTLGTMNPVQELTAKAHAVGATVVLDVAQWVCNWPIDVKKWDCDFIVFSGHKLFGPYGVGVLFGKTDLLKTLPPYQGGGSMISEVSFEKTTYQDMPFRLEAGTPNISGVIALKPAIDYIQALDWTALHNHEQQLLQTATTLLKEIPGLKIHGEAAVKAPIVSFNIAGLHHSDIGQILDQENIAVRTGHHCNQPLMKWLGVTGTVRASFSVFNNENDVKLLVAGVRKAKEMLS
jgi:cysteine desulfurase/selenocysteine lyase